MEFRTPSFGVEAFLPER